MTNESTNKVEVILAYLIEHGDTQDTTLAELAGFNKLLVRQIAKKHNRMSCLASGMIVLLPDEAAKDVIPKGMGDLEGTIWRHLDEHGPKRVAQLASEIGHSQRTVQDAMWSSEHIACYSIASTE